MATDNSQRIIGDRFRIDRAAFHRFDFPLFTGTYRTKQFGLSSAITNITLVLATVLTGYLAEVNWHLPFIVYLFPLISIVLSFYLKKNISPYPGIGINTTSRRTERPADSSFGKFGIQIPHLMQIMSFYGLATYLVIIISFNLPFLMKEYHFTSGNSGIMISLFSWLSCRRDLY